jgi:cytoskeletal protein CcmA (bactofilin family)
MFKNFKGGAASVREYNLVKATPAAVEPVSSIGSGHSIIGKIIGHGALTIWGHVEGELHASTVVIAEGAQMEGDVFAEEVTIGGHVKGTIHANRVKLNNTAVVEGDIFHAEINRLVEENQQLKQFKEKYYDVDKKLAVLKETIKPFRRNHFLCSACLIAGSAGVAAAPSFLSINQYGWYVFFSVSAMLLIAGIAARVEGPSIGTATRQPGLSSK